MRSFIPQLHRTLLVALAVGVVACGSDELTGPDALVVARSRWSDRGPSSYTMTVSRSCECLPEMSGPVDITVRDGVVVARRYVYDSTDVSSSYVSVFPDVEGLFQLVDAELRRGTKPFEAKFDAALGFPTRIVIGDPALDGPVTSVTNLRAQ